MNRNKYRVNNSEILKFTGISHSKFLFLMLGLTLTPCIKSQASNVATSDKLEVTNVQQQNKRTVHGVVTDQNGEPVIGATIAVKGTKAKTVTDIDGRYEIQVINNGTLEISYIGFTTKEVATNGKTSINISLTEDVKSLNDVVVIGYGSQKKVTLTGAVSAITGDKLQERKVASLSNALQGTMPGVTVQQYSGRWCFNPYSWFGFNQFRHEPIGTS